MEKNNELLHRAAQILKANGKADAVYFTTDGSPFVKELPAKTHAKTLEDKEVLTVTREEANAPAEKPTVEETPVTAEETAVEETPAQEEAAPVEEPATEEGAAQEEAAPVAEEQAKQQTTNDKRHNKRK